jgi:hypothetical protein
MNETSRRSLQACSGLLLLMTVAGNLSAQPVRLAAESQKRFDEIFRTGSHEDPPRLSIQIGPIARMPLPPNWHETERRDGRMVARTYRPTAGPARVFLSYSYRGFRLDPQAAAQLCRSLYKRRPGRVNKNEIAALTGALGEKGYAGTFAIQTAMLEELNGKRVLVVDGDYKEYPLRAKSIYIDADQAQPGTVVAELSFVADRDSYGRYLPEVMAAFRRITWRDGKFLAEEC